MHPHRLGCRAERAGCFAYREGSFVSDAWLPCLLLLYTQQYVKSDMSESPGSIGFSFQAPDEVKIGLFTVLKAKSETVSPAGNRQTLFSCH